VPVVNGVESVLIRFFTLTPRCRGWGSSPDDVATAPAPAVERLCRQFSIAPAALQGYAARDQTRTDHLREVAAFPGWRVGAEVESKLDQFLLARAMEHNSASLLFELAYEQLRSSRLIRPGPVWLVERVAAAREAAKAETFARLEPMFTPQLMTDLDGLLDCWTPRSSRS